MQPTGLETSTSLDLDAARMKKKWYLKAAEEYLKSATQGNADSQRMLSSMYCLGDGVEENKEESQKWERKALDSYRKSAERGNAEAEAKLAENLFYKNYAEAVKWWRNAAEQGNAEAMHHLGYMYQQGYGAGKNNAEALK